MGDQRRDLPGDRIDSGDEGGGLSELRRALVDELRSKGAIRTPEVEEAFLRVPRHLFVPQVPPERAYSDEAIPTKLCEGVPISSSSQPAIMALMLEQLDLRPGQRVLEIGAATGYNAALIAHIVGDAGEVTTVDIDEDLVEDARQHLSAAGLGRVRVLRADGVRGHPDGAPFDRIILTVGTWDIAPAWVQQLEAGGRLVLPLQLGAAEISVAFERAGSLLRSVSVVGCGFMPLRGVLAVPERNLRLGPDADVILTLYSELPIAQGTIYEWLTSPSRDLPTGVLLRRRELDGLRVWMSVHSPGVCNLDARGRAADSGIIPCIYRATSGGSHCFACGLVAEDGLCLLMRSPETSDSPVGSSPAESAANELYVRHFGPGDAARDRLMELIAEWDAAGQPYIDALSITAYPQDEEPSTSDGEVIITRRSGRLAFSWS